MKHLLIGWFLMATISGGAFSSGAEPTGASAVFTSSDPIVKQALSLMDDGKFAEAQSLMASDDGHGDPAVASAREEMKEILVRTRREYAQSPADLLAKIKKDIPDATAEDLERWRKAGEAQARIVDGELKYFRREPSNVFRFSEEAKKRREANGKGKKDPEWKLVDHLAAIVAEAEKSGKLEVAPVRHRITYTVSIPGNVKGAKAGSVIRAWLPYPQEYRQQKELKLLEMSPKDGVIAPNAIDGKIIEGAPQRTIYFTQKITDPAKPIEFKTAFEYTSFAYYPILKDELAQPLPADWNGAYLNERLPHIAFSPKIKKAVAEIVGTETNPLAKVRKIFHWIDANIKYHAEEEYTVLPSFSQVCFSRNKGDCGVQSTLFMTMCRIAGVPTRWQSGWETKPDGDSMHDWAEFYVAPWGWLPADQSYGVQTKSNDPKVRDFYIGHQDSYRMIVNLDYGSPLHPPKQSLRSEPADFQRGEVEIDGKNLYYDDWDYDCKIEWLSGK